MSNWQVSRNRRAILARPRLIAGAAGKCNGRPVGWQADVSPCENGDGLLIQEVLFPFSRTGSNVLTGLALIAIAAT